jgi:ketosteroid isomerase-like protein
MSHENVEVVRTFFEAWNARDMDAIRELYDSDAVVRPPEGWPEPGPFVGREMVMRQFQQMRDAWDTDAGEPLSDFIDASDRVVVRTVWRGAGRGPESTMEFTIVFTLRKGRIVFPETFWDHAEALEAVGLSEQDAHADS